MVLPQVYLPFLYSESDPELSTILCPDEDYNPVTQTITFPVGVTSQTVPVDTLDDSIDENEESFSASLSNPMGSGLPFELGDDDTATANIVDTDSTYNYVGFLVNIQYRRLSDIETFGSA